MEYWGRERGREREGWVHIHEPIQAVSQYKYLHGMVKWNGMVKQIRSKCKGTKVHFIQLTRLNWHYKGIYGYMWDNNEGTYMYMYTCLMIVCINLQSFVILTVNITVFLYHQFSKLLTTVTTSNRQWSAFILKKMQILTNKRQGGEKGKQREGG